MKDAAQFQALYAYSPYHHVVDGAKYPAILMETGDNDPRVNPAQSRKFTARLQAANSSQKPILLKTFSDAGHGASELAEICEGNSTSGIGSRPPFRCGKGLLADLMP